MASPTRGYEKYRLAVSSSAPRARGTAFNAEKRSALETKGEREKREMKGERAAKPLTLEEYAGLFHNPVVRGDLSHDQLNQIIYMHGFLKLHRWQKANIVEALDSMDLMRPERSTVREEPPAAAATAAALSLEEVKKDIQLLDWQECPLGSIIMVNAADNKIEAPVPISTQPAPSPSVPAPAAAASGGALPGTSGKRKRKRKKMAALVDVGLRPSLPPPV